jgi:hypothetical protein
MNIYNEWGFSANPFETKPLPPNENGEILLVDRKSELDKIKRRFSSSSNVVTIEGSNGVGKTSLINVASYALYKNFIETGVGPFFIPCETQFQLDINKNIEDFVDEVLMAVAQTLLKKGNELLDRGYKLDNNHSINSWLNSPLLSNYSGNATAGLIGLGMGKGTEANTSAGFQKSGFKISILNWLKEIFPYGTDGGVICIIDNLELLQTSSEAKKILEALRDKLLSYTGLRWALCGSLGIVLGVTSSPRLEGRLSAPIEIHGIDSKYAAEILHSRIKAYSIDADEYYLPLMAEDFEHLYKILNLNIRNTLKYASDYCLWVADEGYHPQSPSDMNDLYMKWLEMQSCKKVAIIKTIVKPKALEIFNKSILMGGEFSPSDYEAFAFNNIQAMRPHIISLEEADLVISMIDESDKRRKTIQITPKGWFFYYGLSLLENAV